MRRSQISDVTPWVWGLPVPHSISHLISPARRALALTCTAAFLGVGRARRSLCLCTVPSRTLAEVRLTGVAPLRDDITPPVRSGVGVDGAGGTEASLGTSIFDVSLSFMWQL
jgi:hypothetical protein